MVTKEYFIDKELPEKLSKEETDRLFKEFYAGSKEAREKIIIHNLRLVRHEVNRRFFMIQCEKPDLFSYGVVGLINAVDNYDLSRGFSFATYAVKSIDNEMIRYVRSIEGLNNIDSLNRVLFEGAHEHELELVDRIEDQKNLFEIFERKEMDRIIRECVEQLPRREREMMKLRFGFYDDQIHTLESIAQTFHISRARVAVIINRILENIKKQLEHTGAIEKQKRNIKKGKKNMSEINIQPTATAEEIILNAKLRLSRLEITKEEFLKILEYVKFTKNKFLIKGLNAEDAVSKILTLSEFSRTLTRKK